MKWPPPHLLVSHKSISDLMTFCLFILLLCFAGPVEPRRLSQARQTQAGLSNPGQQADRADSCAAAAASADQVHCHLALLPYVLPTSSKGQQCVCTNYCGSFMKLQLSLFLRLKPQQFDTMYDKIFAVSLLHATIVCHLHLKITSV